MAGVITNYCERLMLDTAILNAGPFTCKLSSANFLAAEDMTPALFVEAAYGGYAPVTLNYLGLAAGSPGGKALALFDPPSFVCVDSSVPEDMYGYWVEDALGNVLLAERFTGTPRPMRGAGHTVSFPFNLRLFSPL